ncbi:DEAD/DEAH box helicase, partial [Bradyrhizobium sp. SUTN9-2]
RSRGGRGKPQRGERRGHDRERSHEPREARGEAGAAPEARPAREARPPREARPSSEPRNGARPQANSSHVPSIGRPEPRRQREIDSEPGDHSHLPAFLLRPVRSPAGA